MKSTNHKDVNKEEIFIGSIVLMPEPNESDNWSHGGFSAIVKKVQSVHVIGPTVISMLLVEDSDGDCFHVEPERVEVEE